MHSPTQPVVLGSKLISPFGLVGRVFPRGDFKKQLQDYYYPPLKTDETAEGRIRELEETVLMTRFLLDYVIDMGPVSKDPKERPDPPPAAINVVLRPHEDRPDLNRASTSNLGMSFSCSSNKKG